MSTQRKIYEQHDKAFGRVRAWVVVKNGQKVATVAVKFPADGAGRLYAYVHWLGCTMVRGMAGGYGYNKTDAAIADAARKIPHEVEDDARYSEPWEIEARQTFRAVLADDGGWDFNRRLEDAGFQVWGAV